jgi:hypothetical protein
MRIITLLLVAITITSCATHTKTITKKEVANTTTIPVKVETPVHTLPDSCRLMLTKIRVNLKYEFDYNCNSCPEKVDSNLRFLYWPWTMDTVFMYGNSKCWVGLSKNELINILGNPYSKAFWNDKITENYTYMISNNRKNALSQRYFEYWNIDFRNDVIVSVILQKATGIPIESIYHKDPPAESGDVLPKKK